jgi:hypothetical protein
MSSLPFAVRVCLWCRQRFTGRSYCCPDCQPVN